MSLIAPKEIEQLVSPNSGCCLSITMPCHKAGPDVRENAIRFKTLLGRAKAEAGDCDSVLKRSFRALEQLADNNTFWQHQSHGLAVYSDGTKTAIYRLPIPFAEHAQIGLTHLIMPMVPAFSEQRSHYVLCVTKGATRLLQSDGTHVSDVPNDLPDDIRQYLPDQTKSFGLHSFRVRSNSSDAAVPHGHPDTDNSEAVQQYLSEVDEAVRNAIADDSTPLVFAGNERLFAAYRELSSYKSLCDDCVSGNFEDLVDDELAKQSFDVVRPEFEQVIDERLSQADEKAVRGLTVDDIEAVLEASRDGAVDTLFVHQERFLDVPPGSSMPEDDYRIFCRLERAVHDTLANGGHIIAVEGARIGDRHCLASLRYPVDALTVK